MATTAAWWRRKSPQAGKVEEHTLIASEDKEVERPLLYANRLSEEHLQLIFEIQQKQDDQLHSQCILGQRLDILFDALADAPAQTRCPTCGQKYTHVYNIHGRPSSLWSKASRFMFFVCSRCRINVFLLLLVQTRWS
jgi:hypothetical protein